MNTGDTVEPLGSFPFIPEGDCMAAVVFSNCQAISYAVTVGCEARQVGSSHELLCMQRSGLRQHQPASPQHCHHPASGGLSR